MSGEYNNTMSAEVERTLNIVSGIIMVTVLLGCLAIYGCIKQRKIDEALERKHQAQIIQMDKDAATLRALEK